MGQIKVSRIWMRQIVDSIIVFFFLLEKENKTHQKVIIIKVILSQST